MSLRMRLLRHLLAPAAALAALVCVASANVTINGSIDGNTVNYDIRGLDADTDHTVTIEHLGEGGQSNNYDHTSDGNGTIQGSGTPGNSTIHPGDTVRVTVSKDGQAIASKDLKKPKPLKPKRRPWHRLPFWPWNW